MTAAIHARFRVDWKPHRANGAAAAALELARQRLEELFARPVPEHLEVPGPPSARREWFPDTETATFPQVREKIDTTHFLNSGDRVLGNIDYLYRIFRLSGGAIIANPDTVKSFFRDLGLPHAQVEELGKAYRLAKGRKHPDAEAEYDATASQGVRTLLAEIRYYRDIWEAGSEGTRDYRKPDRALPDQPYKDYLGPARALVSRGLLSELDLAFCLFSACMHDSQYDTWLVLCTNSPRAAEAMLDLLMSATPGSFPSRLRAAWCLSRFDDGVREHATHLGLALSSTGPEDLRGLLRAAANDTMMEHVRRMTMQHPAVYGQDQLTEAREFLKQREGLFVYRGSRGLLDLDEETLRKKLRSELI